MVSKIDEIEFILHYPQSCFQYYFFFACFREDFFKVCGDQLCSAMRDETKFFFLVIGRSLASCLYSRCCPFLSLTRKLKNIRSFFWFSFFVISLLNGSHFRERKLCFSFYFTFLFFSYFAKMSAATKTHTNEEAFYSKAVPLSLTLSKRFFLFFKFTLVETAMRNVHYFFVSLNNFPIFIQKANFL